MKLSALKSYSFEAGLAALALLSLLGLLPEDDKVAGMATIAAIVSASIRGELKKRFPEFERGELLQLEEYTAELQPRAMSVTEADEIRRKLDVILQKLNLPPGPTALLLCACFVFGGEAWAREPKAIVSGPRYAEPGEDIYLEFGESEGDPDRFHVSISPSLAGRSQLEVLDGGKRARVKSYPGTWTVRLLVSNEDGWSEHHHVITIPGNPPCPTPVPIPGPIDPLPEPPVPPGPTPPPTPTPIPPAPEPLLPVPAELAELRGQVTTAARQVMSSTRAAEIDRLIAVCRGLQDDATRANPITNPQHFIDTMGNAIASLGDPWRGFLTAVGRKLQTLYLAGDLKSVERWAVLFQEARLGLEAAK